MSTGKNSFLATSFANHKRQRCHDLYNPKKVKEVVPEANLMCAEQTFAWQSRYKKVLNSMKRTHFHFVLHSLIKGRNRYTSLCYKENCKPLLRCSIIGPCLLDGIYSSPIS